jgi:hypothetical protein
MVASVWVRRKTMNRRKSETRREAYGSWDESGRGTPKS